MINASDFRLKRALHPVRLAVEVVPVATFSRSLPLKPFATLHATEAQLSRRVQQHLVRLVVEVVPGGAGQAVEPEAP